MDTPSHQEIMSVFKEVSKTVRELYRYGFVDSDYYRNNTAPFINALRSVDKMESLLQGDYKTVWIMEQEDAMRWEQKCKEAREDVKNIIESRSTGVPVSTITVTATGVKVVLNPEDENTAEFQTLPSAILRTNLDDDVFTCDASMNSVPIGVDRQRSLSFESEADSPFVPIASEEGGQRYLTLWY